MDGQRERQAEGLEDQLRRMILDSSHSSTQPTLSEHAVPKTPTVRLPPAPPRQVLPSNNPATAQSPQRQDQRAQTNGTPQSPHQQVYRGPSNSYLQRQTERQYHPSGQQNGQTTVQRGGHVQSGRAQYRQHLPIDPNAYTRGDTRQGYHPQPRAPPKLFDPRTRTPPFPTTHSDPYSLQSRYMDKLVAAEVPVVEMDQTERDEKETFRALLQNVIHEVCSTDPDRLPRTALESFGSFRSGFASKGSDMDLVIVSQDDGRTPSCFSLLEDDLPRSLEKRLLHLGYGARLLTRTRVPIIKICEKPDAILLEKLREEREHWDSLPDEKKYPHLHQDDDEAGTNAQETPQTTEGAAQTPLISVEISNSTNMEKGTSPATSLPIGDGTSHSGTEETLVAPAENGSVSANQPPQQRRVRDQPWTRERKAGPLDFPKSGIGIQCDINFFNPLGIHNTQLLRCYSLCDTRVRPMILFVKAWAKCRKINSSYSGTLSSYGYVLMVLHYLINIARPAVLPNLQSSWRPNAQCTPSSATATEVDGWKVEFWSHENEILRAVQAGQMSSNRESLGSLLAGFFTYYSSQGGFPQFVWMKDVLALRVAGGLMSKEQKGWVKAHTEEGEGKKVQHRYLFCIEDPFELDHNVARTVTHNGIVAIRDEFRRAKRILQAVGQGLVPQDGELFTPMVEVAPAAAVSKATDTDANQAQTPGTGRGKHAPRANGHALPSAPPKSFNVQDADAFPSLSAAAKPMPKPKQATATDGVISGERAKKYLEELKRKKMMDQAEVTATGAAESVLNGT